jgi:hypothetical protein
MKPTDIVLKHFPEVEIKWTDRNVSFCLWGTLYLSRKHNNLQTIVHELVHHEQQQHTNILWWLFRYAMPQSLSLATLPVGFALLLLASSNPPLLWWLMLVVAGLFTVSLAVGGSQIPDTYRQEMEAAAVAVSAVALRRSGVPLDRVVSYVQERNYGGDAVYMTTMSKTKRIALCHEMLEAVESQEIDYKMGLTHRIYVALRDLGQK